MSDTTDRMQDAARALGAVLPPGTGFILLAFDFKPGGRMDYVSNTNREDVVHALHEAVDKFTAEKFSKHADIGGNFEFDPRLPDIKLWAWMGEDELGSKDFGIKQAIVPAGNIPIVACKPGKIDHEYIRMQMRCQARVFHKTISLVRFGFERIDDQVNELTPPA